MRGGMLKHSAVVFAGGASYGFMGTVAKLAFSAGFTWPQMVASQAFFGVLLFAAAFAVQLARGQRPVALPPRRVASLLGLGMTTCTTCVLYNSALSVLPVPVAITLLFQFTWIGIIIQVAATRRRPHAAEAVAAVVILGGTFLASGLFSGDLSGLDPVGVACGLLSAVSCAAFMHLSGRIGVGVPPIQRGLIVCLGSLILGLIVCPTYFASGALQAGVWKYGIVLGLFSLFIPVILFGIATPHLPTGISTIMASSELPCGILVSVVVLGEPVGLLQAVGVAIILAGVVVSQLPQLLPGKEGGSGGSS